MVIPFQVSRKELRGTSSARIVTLSLGSSIQEGIESSSLPTSLAALKTSIQEGIERGVPHGGPKQVLPASIQEGIERG